jgi:hypothetical protein
LCIVLLPTALLATLCRHDSELKGVTSTGKRAMLVSVMTGRWELDRAKLDPDHSIAMGETPFGLVYEGALVRARLDNVRVNPDKEQDLIVVVKKLTAGAPPASRTAFMREIQFMKVWGKVFLGRWPAKQLTFVPTRQEINHENIVRLIAVVTTEDPILMVFENHANGSLKSYLTANRNSMTQHNIVWPAYSTCIVCGPCADLVFCAAAAHDAGRGTWHGFSCRQDGGAQGPGCAQLPGG